jgi:hypothetical protein
MGERKLYRVVAGGSNVLGEFVGYDEALLAARRWANSLREQVLVQAYTPWGWWSDHITVDPRYTVVQ